MQIEKEYHQKIIEIANFIKSSNKFNPKKQQIKDVFDWWKENVKYDYSILNKQLESGKYAGCYYDYKGVKEIIFIGSKYSPILLHKGICSGFAEAFKDICDLINVECKIIKSDDRNVKSSFKKYAHQWNEVYIDGKWFTIDLDPNFLTFMGELRTTKFQIHK